MSKHRGSTSVCTFHVCIPIYEVNELFYQTCISAAYCKLKLSVSTMVKNLLVQHILRINLLAYDVRPLLLLLLLLLLSKCV